MVRRRNIVALAGLLVVVVLGAVSVLFLAGRLGLPVAGISGLVEEKRIRVLGLFSVVSEDLINYIFDHGDVTHIQLTIMNYTCVSSRVGDYIIVVGEHGFYKHFTLLEIYYEVYTVSHKPSSQDKGLYLP